MVNNYLHIIGRYKSFYSYPSIILVVHVQQPNSKSPLIHHQSNRTKISRQAHLTFLRKWFNINPTN